MNSPGGNAEITNPVIGNLGTLTGVGFFQQFIPSLIRIAFVIGIIIFFFMLITGAISWISSGGDKAALETARGKITNALIGIVLLFSVYVIAQLIEAFFGITILTLDIAPLLIQ